MLFFFALFLLKIFETLNIFLTSFFAVFSIAISIHDIYFLGRIICGLGALIYISAALYVIKSTTSAERSATFTQMNMMFALAMMIGPIVNLPLAGV